MSSKKPASKKDTKSKEELKTELEKLKAELEKLKAYFSSDVAKTTLDMAIDKVDQH